MDSVFKVPIKLTQTDGNAFFIISACRSAARRAGIDGDDIDAFTTEAQSGDYDHVLQTCMRYFEVS